MNNKKLIAAGSVAILLAVGCSSDNSEEAIDEPTDETEEIQAVDDAIFGLGDSDGEVESRDDLTNLLATSVVAVFADDNNVRVDFEMGDPECQGAQVQLFENSDSIEVSVRVGELPGRTFSDCQDAIGNFFTVVELDSPAGDRSIVAAEELEPDNPGADLGEPDPIPQIADGEVAVENQVIDPVDVED